MAFAVPAQAQNRQEGLVNVAVEDTAVQVPIAVAANICDVNVAVLARVFDPENPNEPVCTATADSAASASSSGGPPTRQEGLVNVLIDNVAIQVPIALAANVCDVNVAVLAEIIDGDPPAPNEEACLADADSLASAGPGGGGNGSPAAGSSANATAFEPIDLDLEIVPNLRILDGDLGT